jgi:hypothetical protein
MYYEVARVSHSFFQFSTQSDGALIKTSKQMFFTLISPERLTLSITGFFLKN